MGWRRSLRWPLPLGLGASAGVTGSGGRRRLWRVQGKASRGGRGRQGMPVLYDADRS